MILTDIERASDRKVLSTSYRMLLLLFFIDSGYNIFLSRKHRYLLHKQVFSKTRNEQYFERDKNNSTYSSYCDARDGETYLVDPRLYFSQ